MLIDAVAIKIDFAPAVTGGFRLAAVSFHLRRPYRAVHHWHTTGMMSRRKSLLKVSALSEESPVYQPKKRIRAGPLLRVNSTPAKDPAGFVQKKLSPGP